MWLKALAVVFAVAVVITALDLILNRVLVYRPPAGHVCMSNLKQISQAVMLYQDDYSLLPSSALASSSERWNQENSIWFCTRNGAHKGGYKTLLDCIGRYNYTHHYFHCPCDPSDPKDPNAFASYWWRLAVDKAWFGEGCAKPRRTNADYRLPGKTAMLIEPGAWFGTDKSRLHFGNGVNVAFLDGHVKFQKISSIESRLLNVSGIDRGGEPMYFNYNYDTGKGLPNDKTPAKWVDPAVYGDKL